MTKSPTDEESPAVWASLGGAERIVYVIPDRAILASTDDEISLRELWRILWRGKWIIIAVTALFATGSVAYALLATEWYRAEVLLAPVEQRSTPTLGGQLGGLVALAGVSVGGGDSAESLAVLRSKDFARAFIEEFQLMPVLFADDWDPELNSWRAGDDDDAPDIRDGVRYFRESILKAQESLDTGLVTMSVEWTDPVIAAKWAETLVRRLNDRLRERALQEAETNVAYLQSEVAQTSLVTLQQSIGRLLEGELQKLMLARGNAEFAFRVVDAPEVPKERVRPKRTMIAIAGTMLGGILGIVWVFILNAARANSLESNA